jgi:hypothetical protein
MNVPSTSRLRQVTNSAGSVLFSWNTTLFQPSCDFPTNGTFRPVAGAVVLVLGVGTGGATVGVGVGDGVTGGPSNLQSVYAFKLSVVPVYSGAHAAADPGSA